MPDEGVPSRRVWRAICKINSCQLETWQGIIYVNFSLLFIAYWYCIYLVVLVQIWSIAQINVKCSQIRSVRRSLSRHALLTLVRALIVSKVDYCNSVLVGIPGQLQDRLQSVLNASSEFGFLSEAVRTHSPIAS